MIAVISDVHGNFPALKAVLEEIDKLGCEKIISLGDVAGYYCAVNECIDEFRRRSIINMMGNHDSYLLGLGKCPRSLTVNQCIDYQRKIITVKNIEYLKKSPLAYLNNTISARHGGWSDPIDEYIENFDFSITKGSVVNIFCSGHTHIQKIQKQSDKTYFNPGAVGQPRDGDAKAGYAIIDSDLKIHLCRVQYDIEEIVNWMNEAGFSSRVSDCLYKGEKIRTYST